MMFPHTAEQIKNRIAVLEARNPVENAAIIRKLKRKLSKIDK